MACNGGASERRVGVRTVVLVLALLALVATGAAAQPPGPRVDEEQVYDVASQLRCVVCQNLSVADSPSEMASQMRVIVRERLAAGQTPAQVRQYFVERYGDWILLAPPRRGFTLLVWLAPLAAVIVGVAIVAVLVVRWTRRRPTTAFSTRSWCRPSRRSWSSASISRPRVIRSSAATACTSRTSSGVASECSWPSCSCSSS